MIRKKEICSLRTGTGLLLVALVIGFLAPTGALAAAFGVNGQVFRIDPGDAAEEAILDADLVLRDTVPYVKVRVLNAASRAVLGEATAGENGNFAVVYEAPPGTEVEVQALSVVEGDGDPLPAAREGINTFTPAGAATAMAVRVIASGAVSLAPAGTADPGVGFLFTEIGKVEIPYICQAECTNAATCPTKICNADEIGLATMIDPADRARAATLGLPSDVVPGNWNGVFHNAPFGGTLFIFGAFGPPKGTPGCNNTTDWYRVRYRQLPAGGWNTWTQKLEKQRYELTYTPTGLSADSYLELVGPISGSVPNLYRVDPLPSGSGTAVVVNSFANLRMLWRTGGLADGLYEIELEYFTEIPGGTATNPNVAAIPGGCVDPGVITPDDQNQVAVNRLRLRINNQPPTTALDGIFIKSAANQYLAGVRANCIAPPPGRTPLKASAIDFNGAANRCDIMELDDTVSDVVEIDFKARHDSGYLRSYSLRARSNAAPPQGVPFASDHYGNHSGSVLWHGLCSPAPATPCATPTVSQINTAVFPQPCAYDFDLVVRTRNQNGYGYLHRPHIHRAYYVRP